MERPINPIFNIFEKYKEVNIINPHRFGGGAAFTNADSFDFNGSTGYIDFGDVLDFERTDAFSVGFWVKFDNVASTRYLITKRNSSKRGIALFTTSSSQFGAALNSTVGTNSINKRTNDSFSNGVWYHIVVTYDGSSNGTGLKTYADGSLASMTGLTNNLTATITNSDSLRIGSGNPSADPSNYFDGHLDEVTIWDKELSAPEVTELYNSGVPFDLTTHSAAANLVHYVRADDDTTGAGNVIDHSTSGFDGTIVGGVTIVADVP